jgi:hypothetical protein
MTGVNRQHRGIIIPGLISLVTLSLTAYAADQTQSLNSTLEPYLKEFGLPALSALVSADILKKLHTPVIDVGERKDAAPGTPKSGGGYARGWGKVKTTWAPELVVTHTGSNTLNLATAVFLPGADFGFVMMTNISGKGADDALHKLTQDLYNQFGKTKSGRTE